MNRNNLFYRFETTRLAQVDDAVRFTVTARACIHQPDGALTYSPEQTFYASFQITGKVMEDDVRKGVARCGQQLGVQIAVDQAVAEGLIHEEAKAPS